MMRRFLAGTVYLGRGLRLWGTSPRIMLLGAVPALVVGAVYVTAIVLLASSLPEVVAWATPFADTWSEAAGTAVRAAVGVAIVVAVVLLAVVTFAVVTLAVGDPFYERIARHVEVRLGDAPTGEGTGFWRGLWSGIRLLATTAAIGLLLFVCGFIPVIGQIVVPVAGAAVGGWFLVRELTGFAFDARDVRAGDRRRMLGARRAEGLGLGILTYVLFLVPLAAVVIMPAAVAGATMFARDALAETPESAAPRPVQA